MNSQATIPFQPASLSDAELLTGLLHAGAQVDNFLVQAETLLQKFGGLRGLQIASRMLGKEHRELDDHCANQILIAHELVQRQLKKSLQRGITLTRPATTIQFL